MNQEIGHVNTGDFRRGQGGLFCAMSRPYHATNAPDLYIESEQRRTLIDLGYNNRWELTQNNKKFKKDQHLRHTKQEMYPNQEQKLKELQEMKTLQNS